MRDFRLYRNRYSGATFVVTGDEAAARMAELPSWELVVAQHIDITDSVFA